LPLLKNLFEQAFGKTLESALTGCLGRFLAMRSINVEKCADLPVHAGVGAVPTPAHSVDNLVVCVGVEVLGIGAAAGDEAGAAQFDGVGLYKEWTAVQDKPV
jgi:hypothetical protein